MALRTLALALAAGILWADAGRVGLPRGVAVASAVLVGVALASSVAGARRSPWRGDRRRSRLLSSRWLAGGAALLLTFEAGHAALDARLRAAALDATRAQRAGTEGLRIAEARVVARKPGRWGDEVELSGVLGVDGGSELPSRLRLRLGRPRPDSRAASDTERPASAPAAFESRADALLWPGAAVRLGLLVSPLGGARNPGTPDRERRTAREGVAASARLVDPAWVLVRTLPDATGLQSRVEALRGLGTRLHRRVGIRLREAGDASGLVRALALGDRSGIPPDLSEGFRRLGLSHLLAVSGLHVGLVAGLMSWLGLRAIGLFCPGLSDPFPAVLGIAVGGALIYVGWTGGSASAQRAGGVILLVGVVTSMRRRSQPLDLLAAVALTMGILEPAMLFDLGARLSFSACLGLVLAGVWSGSRSGDGARPASKVGPGTRAERIRAGLGMTLRSSCAAGFGTGPVLMLGGLPLAGLAPACNLLAIPWTALVLLPASLGAAVLAMLAELGVELWPRQLLSWLETGLALWIWPAEAMARAVHWGVEHLPTTSLIPAAAPRSWVAAVFFSGVGLLCLRAGALRAALLCWAILVAVAGLPRADGGDFADRPRVWFFDVGQGDAALIEGRTGTMLIDTGPGPPDGSGGTALVRSLASIGLRSLDLLVVTHADLDHRGGARRVLDALDVGELWLPEGSRGEPSMEALSARARSRGTTVSWRSSAPGIERRGDLSIETLWPPAPRSAGSGRARSRNAGSLVLRVALAGRSFLFMADVDAEIEQRLSHEQGDRVRADVLKVSHHGSRGGTRRRFLEVVRARDAVISAPCNPSRGLPSRAVLERISASSTRLWWTGRDGAVVFFPDRPRGAKDVLTWAIPRVCGEPTRIGIATRSGAWHRDAWASMGATKNRNRPGYAKLTADDQGS